MSLPSLPSLPTDNLYKFMAITGVVLFVGAPVYWATFYFQLAEKETASQVARVELREQILEYAHLPPPPKRGEQLSPGVSEAWAKQRETVDTRRKELRLAEAQYTLFRSLSAIVNSLSIISALAGVAIGYRGFRLWYVRVQRPQDQILLRQATGSKDESGLA